MPARLKLSFFTPLPPLRTDIANHSARLLPALAKLADVTVWTAQRDWSRTAVEGVQVRRFTADIDPAEINRAGLCFYNLGNDSRYHAELFAMSVRLPGVVILHDLAMQHFFGAIASESAEAFNRHLNRLARFYGAAAVRDALAYRRQELVLDKLVARYPLTEAAIDRALGAIVHNEAVVDRLRQATRLPVFYTPLSYDPQSAVPAEKASREQVKLVVFGFLGSNRRLGSIVQALATHPQRDRFRLDILGVVDFRKSLETLIGKLGARHIVSLQGYVDDHALDAALAQADLAINLRYPSMGEASGSQLRIWAHGLPSLVTRIGWYAALPPDTLFFVDPQHEVGDIQAHLSAFLRDPKPFWAAGLRGRRVLETEHGVDRYAQCIVRIAEQRSVLLTRRASLDLAWRVSSELGAVIGQAQMSAVAPQFARHIHGLFGAS